MDPEEWIESALIVWREVAPSYVQADLTPSRYDLREMYMLGASVERFREALEHSFTMATVTKRKALFVAYTIVKSEMAGDK